MLGKIGKPTRVAPRPPPPAAEKEFADALARRKQLNIVYLVIGVVVSLLILALLSFQGFNGFEVAVASLLAVNVLLWANQIAAARAARADAVYVSVVLGAFAPVANLVASAVVLAVLVQCTGVDADAEVCVEDAFLNIIALVAFLGLLIVTVAAVVELYAIYASIKIVYAAQKDRSDDDGSAKRPTRAARRLLTGM